MNPKRARWIVVGIVVVGFMIVGALAGNDDTDTRTAAPTTTPLTATPPGSAAEPTAPTVPADASPAPSTDAAPSVPPSAEPTVPPPTSGPPSGPAATARWILTGIAVKGRAPKTGYDRARFGPAWSDNVDVAGGHNGCDTRNDILRRDLNAITTRPGTRGCIITSGVLADPYTGRRIDFVRGETTSIAVQIDHVVALSDAWQTGAQQLDDRQRRDLANDPLNLLAVDGPTNMAKRDGDAATWLPPNKAFRCRYVAIQTWVKARYHLWMTPAEHAAIGNILASCTDAQIGAIG